MADAMMPEIPALYEVAKQVCHDHGIPWTDPRTGVTYQPPHKKKKPRTAVKRKRGSAKSSP